MTGETHRTCQRDVSVMSLTESALCSVVESGRFPFNSQQLIRVFIQRESQVTCRQRDRHLFMIDDDITRWGSDDVSSVEFLPFGVRATQGSSSTLVLYDTPYTLPETRTHFHTLTVCCCLFIRCVCMQVCVCRCVGVCAGAQVCVCRCYPGKRPSPGSVCPALRILAAS